MQIFDDSNSCSNTAPCRRANQRATPQIPIPTQTLAPPTSPPSSRDLLQAATPGPCWIFPEEPQSSLPGRAELEHELLPLTWVLQQRTLPQEDNATFETKLKAKPSCYRQKQADTEWVFPPNSHRGGVTYSFSPRPQTAEAEGAPQQRPARWRPEKLQHGRSSGCI